MSIAISRDERGWRVPRPGTKSRAIYDMMVLGKHHFEISRTVGGNPSTVGVLMWKIRNPATSNAYTVASFRNVRDRIRRGMR